MDKIFITSFLKHDYPTLEFKIMIVLFVWVLVVISIGIDLISGYRKAKIRGENRTSYGLRRTVEKCVLYFSLMLFAFMFDCIGTFLYTLPYVTLIAAAFLIFIEGKSILEKAHDKDKRKLNQSLNELAVLLDHKDDLVKGLVEIIKKQQETERNKTIHN